MSQAPCILLLFTIIDFVLQYAHHSSLLPIMILIIFFSIVPLFSSAQNVSSTQCRNQTCGRFPVQYPFGFSSGCPIQLNCTVTTNGSLITEIAGFQVRNVTDATIFIDLPQECERPIENFSSLFAKKFAPTGRNYLLLSNCSSQTPSNCVIQPRLAGNVLKFQSCETRNNINTNIHCYSGIEEMEEFLDYGKVTGSGYCSFMYSSVFVDYQIGSGNTSAISLESGRMELGWWINGGCSTGSCHPNATCLNVTEALGLNGHRCNCNIGYAGDGFADGESCHKVNYKSTQVSHHGDKSANKTISIFFSAGVALLLGILVGFFLGKRSKLKPKEEALETDVRDTESLLYDFGKIRAATNDFSEDNKLGHGGFGDVYRGKFMDGQVIAVKRMSKASNQGDLEFKNEVAFLAKLQHRNVVRLLGFSQQGIEKLLVYEFLENASLNHFIFDPTKRACLNWDTCYNIIGGIAKGLLYMHEDSRLRIIHRDIKPSNILLDGEMNPKIADFGMARLFALDESQGITSRIVGTYGYMAPEYAWQGQFSMKLDVFSFGVLILEIISGQKNNKHQNQELVEDLLITRAWKHWRNGTAESLIDCSLKGLMGFSPDILRCIHISLLCVQRNASERPTMASVVLMLSSYNITLPIPSKPAYVLPSDSDAEVSNLRDTHEAASHVNQSINCLTISELDPR